jgi:hypothetical protein
MKRSIKVERTYKLSEYNSYKVGQEIIEVEDHDSQELVDQLITYINVSNDKAVMEYSLLQKRLTPMNDKDALIFLAEKQEEALKKIQLILNKENNHA